MKQRLNKWISSNWPVFFLVVFEVILAWKNIVPGTWLTGWDSTQPELNFKLNFVRSITSVWQEYRGLGLPDGMAHAANIVHLFYVWILSLVIPDNLVRYFFVFLSHLVGGMGMYKLLQYLLKKSSWLDLAGATLYLLNPITIQMFYQPLELFIIHYGGLPWLVFTVMRYLEVGGKRNLIWLAITLLAFVSQNHVPTIFIVTMVSVGLILLSSLVASIGKSFKKILVVVGLILGINSFWLLPYMVTTVSNSQVISQAKMNLLSNPEMILRNAEYGDLSSVAKMQGFSLNYEDWHLDGPTGLQMPQWGSWWAMQSVQIIMWIVFGLAFVGIVKTFWKRDWRMMPIGMIWLVGLFNLGVRIPVIEKVMTWVYANVPLYSVIFRLVFTKFSIVFAFSSTILAIYVLDGLVKKWGKILLGMIMFGASLWIGWPAFNGNFLYKELRVNFPSGYHKLFTYFDQAETGRVARLPAFDLWGWESNSWGYRGSGIVWQGLRSPILLRSFDPWSLYNEGFYDEFSTALYGEDKNQVMNVLKKYDVRYVLLDESVIAPGQDKEILRKNETKKMAEELGWKKVFNENFLTVWDMGGRSNQFVSSPASYSWVNGDTSKVRKDVVWENVGTYISGQGTVNGIKQNMITYPFAGLMKEEIPTSRKAMLGVGMNVEYGDKTTTLRTEPVEYGLELVIPGWKVGDIVRIEYATSSATSLGTGWEPLPSYYVNGEPGPIFLGKENPEEGKNIIYARISEGKEWAEYLKERKFDLPAQAGLQGLALEVEVPSQPQIYDFGKEGQAISGNCDVLKRGTAEKQGNQYTANWRGVVCDYVIMKELDTRLSYLMNIQGKNKEGRSVKFFLYNTGSKRNDIEYLLSKNQFDQTFSLLPWGWDGFYSLNIDVRSFGQETENLLSPVEVRWFPIEQIAKAKLIPVGSDLVGSLNDLQPTRSDLRVVEVKKTGTWLYRVKVEGSGLLKLSQGYDDGWIAPPIQHVKVDGWANGWIINGSGDITIFYWPQLLEYFGFVVLGVTIWVLASKRE